MNHLIGKRCRFVATISGEGNGGYLLLKDVRFLDGAGFREHLWVPRGKRWRAMGLDAGDVVRIRGKVNRYYKGKGRRKLAQWCVTNIDEIEKTGAYE